MKKINIYLTEKQLLELKVMSKNTGLCVSEIVRRSIDKYFKGDK